MSLERKLNARQIVMRVGMSAQPEVYSGRGAIIDDLTSQKLETIYGYVQNQWGEDAAKQFVQMVADVPVLSATDFLLSLYRLETSDWKWDKKLLGREKGISIGPDYGDGKREANAYATVISALEESGNRDETGAIRNLFLVNHGVGIPTKKRL